MSLDGLEIQWGWVSVGTGKGWGVAAVKMVSRRAMPFVAVGGNVTRSEVLRFYPHFSTFLTHMTSRALSFPRHLPTCTQHVPPNHGTYSCLYCTYVHYSICPCPCLVSYSCATASYHISLTRSSLTRSSPLVLYTFPIWYAS
jgi:hypothetical protein